MICRFTTAFPELWWTTKKATCRVLPHPMCLSFLCFECRVETVCAHYKQCANIKTYTTLYKISVLLVSLVYILLICRFPTAFSELWWTRKKRRVEFAASDVCWGFSLLNVVWKLCMHTTNNVQTSKPTQHCIKSAYCWCHWCRFCWFVVFQLLFLKFDEPEKATCRVLPHPIDSLSLFWMSCGNCVRRLQTTDKDQNLHNIV